MNPNDYYIHSFKQIGAQIDQINKFHQILENQYFCFDF